MVNTIYLTPGWNLVSSMGYTVRLGDAFGDDLEIIKDIYTYNQDNELSRIEVNEDTQLLRGASYWIFVIINPIELNVNDDDDNEDDYTFSLTKGWNVINSPFDRSIDIDSFFGEKRDNVVVVLEYIFNEYRVVTNVLRKGRAYWVLMNEASDVTVTKPELKEGTFIYLTQYSPSNNNELPVSNIDQSFESLDSEQSVDNVSGKTRVHVNFAYNENTLSVYDGLSYTLLRFFGIFPLDDIIEQFDGIPLMRRFFLDDMTPPSSFSYFDGAIRDGAGAPTLLQNTSLNKCFYQCLISNDAFGNDIPYWNTSNVVSMEYMFDNAYDFNQPLNDWNTSNVTDMSGMFKDAINFNQSLNTWNTSNVTNMSSMFNSSEFFAFLGMLSEFNQPLNDWNTSNVNNMSLMFYKAYNFNQSLNTWNTSNVNDMSGMFKDANKFNQSLNTWDTSNVTNMSSMFNSSEFIFFIYGILSKFNQPLNDWNTSNVTDMSGMFKDANKFNQPLNDWNTSNVNYMSNMFAFTDSFNQPLNTWDTSNVNTMYGMFAFANNFNQPLNDWNTSNVNIMKRMFRRANNFNQPLNDWNTSNVNSMDSMFQNAEKFNQPLNDWNTSNVINMSYMFFDNYNFNQPLNDWDTSNVNDMNYMFYRANDFNQNITNWPVRDNITATNMFLDATTWLLNYENINGIYNYNGPANDWREKLNGQFIYHTYTEVNDDTLPIVNDNQGFRKLTYSSCDDGFDGRTRVTVEYEWDRSKDYCDAAKLDGLDFYGSNDVIESFGGIPLIRQRAENYPRAFYKFTGTICDGAGVPTLLHNTSLEDCFLECKISNDAFGNDLPYWDTSNVTNMIWMFNNATNFNQPLNAWNTSNVNSMSAMFYNDDNFNQPLNDWNTSNVNSMSYMFDSATNFNQPLNNWNTSNVNTMGYMFAFTNDFNQSLNNWNTSNVINMSYMFLKANDFNQDITNWPVCDNLVGNAFEMFCDATTWLANYRRIDNDGFNFDGPANDWTTKK